MVKHIFLFNSRTFFHGKLYSIFYAKSQINSAKQEYSFFQEIIKEAKRYVSTWNGQLVIVYIPGQSLDGKWRSSHISNEEFLELVEEVNVPVINLQPIVSQHEDPNSLYALGIILSDLQSFHFSAKGYKLVADYIIAELKKKYL